MEEFRRTTERSWVFRNVVCGKNEPAGGPPVFVYDIPNRLEIVAGFFQEISGQLIEIHSPDIDPLAAAAARREIFGCPGFGSRLGQVNWVGERLEIDIRKEPVKGGTVVYERFLEHLRWSLPRIAMGKGMTPEFMPLFEKGGQILHGKYLTAWRGLIHQAKRRIVRSRDSEPVQYGPAGANCRSRKIVKCKRNQGSLRMDRKKSPLGEARNFPLVKSSQPGPGIRKWHLNPPAAF